LPASVCSGSTVRAVAAQLLVQQLAFAVGSGGQQPRDPALNVGTDRAIAEGFPDPLDDPAALTGSFIGKLPTVVARSVAGNTGLELVQ